jgi:glycerol-3-phosphate dehydrogenase (NAD(P)+)
VAAGMCKGMGSGDNLMAVLVSYAIAEMRTFLRVMQPNTSIIISPENLPPYVGDLLVTCYSQLSRNRTFGAMIGRGYTVKSAQLEMHMIAEGYYAAKSLEKVRKERHIDMPIAQAVYMVLYENARPDVILRAWQIRTSNNN